MTSRATTVSQPGPFVLLLSLFLSSVAFAAPAEDSEWAHYRGPGVDGISLESEVFSELAQLGLEVAWKKKIGSGYSGIAVAGGKVVTMYADGASDVIAAFDAADGRKLWSYAFGDTYAGHDGSHDGPISTPLIADGRVFGLGPWGHFFALDLATGEEIWKTHLAEDLGAEKPHYGFGTSPISSDGVVLLEVGGEGMAIAGFDPASGEKKWAAGSDSVGYQVPVPMTLGGRRQIVGAGEELLFGLDPRSGELLWEWQHGGSGGLGALSMTPVPAGENRIFLAHQDDASKLVEIALDNGDTGDVTVSAAWEGRNIRNSYNVPIYHDGHLYAFSSRFLTCVDAATGNSLWRSRRPGDGFLILVDGRLVIVTKRGGVHVALATPEGYREVAALALFEDLSWTAPSFAGGSIYVRSLGEIARVNLTAAGMGSAIEMASPKRHDGSLSGSAFGDFLAQVDAAADDAKAAVVDRFLAAQGSFPIVEDDTVHFVYRGEASDVAVAGDLVGARQEQVMTRVPGTHLFYHSHAVERAARANYLFIKDYEPVRDPRNPRLTTTTFMGTDMDMAFGDEELEMSWFAMPGWKAPAYLEEAPAASRGRIESQELESESLKGEETAMQIDVYLPRGYDEGEERFPVAYIHGGKAARERGRLANSLDNLIGDRVAPLIAVFVDIPARGPAYDQAFTTDVVPFVDGKYRTAAAPESRANIGSSFAGVAAMVTTLSHPQLFGKVATQSLPLFTGIEGFIYPLIEGLGEDAPVIYMDWGTYDLRNPDENWDLGAANARLAKAFADKGLELAGGEVHDGTGWSSWRNRTGEIFEALFPLR